MDKVFIEALEVECTIGIHDWERRIKQPIVLDIEMGFDNRTPAATDAIEDTLDYACVASLARKVASERDFLLLEALAETLCARIFAEHPALSVRIKVSKRVASLGASAVGVVIHRERGSA